MRAPSLLAVTGLLWCLTASAAPLAKVTEARKLIDDLELDAALKALDAAEKTEGNERATLQEIYTLQGIAFGTLGKEAKTRDSFRKLLLIAPEATLPSDLPPRVRTPFFEAKDWVSTNGPLRAVPGAELGDGLVRSVKVTIEKDVLRLARAVRFHFKVNGVEQRSEVPLTAGRAVAPVGKPSATWWAELLNERGGVVQELGSAERPREEWTGESPLAKGTPGVESGAGSGGWRRPVGIAVLGAGAVAAGIGVALGVQANAARAKVNDASRDELGRVTSLTQREAQALETSARSQATIANVLFGVGGGLAAAGVVLIILGPGSSDEPTVALSPAPGGLTVSGTF
jgi:hypothetical protein